MYSASFLLKRLNSKHQREVSEARKSSSSSNKAVSDSSSPTPKQRKLATINQASIESYRPVKQLKINDRKQSKFTKNNKHDCYGQPNIFNYLRIRFYRPVGYFRARLN